jgi:membrane protein involved in colicin uptake
MKGADLHWRLQFAVDEKLGNYWRSIKGAMQLRLYFKEKYQRKTLNIKMMPDDKLNMLESAQRG